MKNTMTKTFICKGEELNHCVRQHLNDFPGKKLVNINTIPTKSPEFILVALILENK